MESVSTDLAQLRVLVVEDNDLIAEVVREQFDSEGCTVVGPAANVEGGLELAQHETLDGAVLDINLAGKYCFPIAEALMESGIPFVFLSGCDDESIIPLAFRDVPLLRKPFRAKELMQAARSLFCHAA